MYGSPPLTNPTKSELSETNKCRPLIDRKPELTIGKEALISISSTTYKSTLSSVSTAKCWERTEHAEYVERNNKRVNKNPDYYRERQQIIEHQFGTLKRHRHFDYTLMKGKEKVLGEVYIAFTMYNLRRSLSILGMSGLIKRLKAIFEAILAKLNLIAGFAVLSSLNLFASRKHLVVSCGSSIEI